MKQDLNFFDVYTESQRKAMSELARAVIAVTVLLALILVAFGGLTGVRLYNDSLSDGIERGMQAAGAVSTNAAVASQTAAVAKLRQYTNGAKSAGSAVFSGTAIDSALLAALSNALPADTTVTTVSVNQGNIILTCQCASANSASLYLANLNRTGLFSQLYDSGIMWNAGTANYSFTMTCALQAGGAQ